MKADLHYHGLIGFQEYWLKKQGYEGKNLLQLVADTCLDKGIDICAITSEEKEIPRGSVHDRFDYLVQKSSELPKSYKADKLGDNVLVVENDGKNVYLINGQAVQVMENGKHFDHCIVGSNDVPNLRNFSDTIKYGKDNGLIQIATHPYVEAHFGMGGSRLRDLLDDYDAIEGHNSQLVFPAFFSRVPVLGNYAKHLNKKAQAFAFEHNKPYVAVSDGHRIESAGISYIEFDKELDTNNDKKMLAGLKEIIKSGNFSTVENYESFGSWLDWVSKFKIGTSLKKDI